VARGGIAWGAFSLGGKRSMEAGRPAPKAAIE